MLKRKIYFDKNAEKEFRKLSEEVQLKFDAYVELLKREGRLEYPEARKI